MDETTYFKVVRNVAGRYFSAQISGTYQVEYEVAVWATSPIGSLFLFRTEAAAEKFIGAVPGDLEIWECKAANVSVPTVILQDAAVKDAGANRESLSILRTFWDSQTISGYNSSARYGSATTLRPPTGTLLASSIYITVLA